MAIDLECVANGSLPIVKITIISQEFTQGLSRHLSRASIVNMCKVCKIFYIHYQCFVWKAIYKEDWKNSYFLSMISINIIHTKSIIIPKINPKTKFVVYKNQSRCKFGSEVELQDIQCESYISSDESDDEMELGNDNKPNNESGVLDTKIIDRKGFRRGGKNGHLTLPQLGFTKDLLIETMMKSKNLQDLTLYHTDLSVIEFEKIIENTNNLKTLKIMNCFHSTQVICLKKLFSCSPSLESLHVEGLTDQFSFYDPNLLSNHPFGAPTDIPTDFSACPMSKTNIRGFSKLMSLSLKSCLIFPSDIIILIRNCPRLIEISIADVWKRVGLGISEWALDAESIQIIMEQRRNKECPRNMFNTSLDTRNSYEREYDCFG